MNSTSLFAPRALLRDGWASDVRVTIAADGRIRGVERDVKPRSEDRCLTDRVLLPAPANVHSHAFQRALAGRTQRRGPGEDDFWSWRRLLYRFLEGLTPEMIGAITAQAQLEMCEAGYAAVAEFHYLHHAPGGRAYANPAEISERIMEAAQATGIGLSLLPVIYSTGGADGGAPTGVQLRFACDAEKYDLLWRSAASSLGRGPTDWRIGIAPHSLRAVPRDILAEVLAAHPKGPVHMHIAEQIAEVEEIESAWSVSPITWLLDHHAVDERWCLVHATHANEAECANLAKSGAVVGLCPITEADLGDGVFPGELFLTAGGRFGVGTDSNVRITLSGELNLLEYSQRLAMRRRNVISRAGESSGKAIFDAVLVGGALALGRRSGAIESGYFADLLTLDATTLELHGLDGDELLDGWIFSAQESLVGEVWSAGRQTVEHGRHFAREVISSRYRDVMDALIATL